MQMQDTTANALGSLKQAAPGLSHIACGKEIWNLRIYVAQLFEKYHVSYIVIKA